MNPLRFAGLAILLLAAPLAGQGGEGRGREEFQPGDLIRLEVEGDTTLTGEFTVGPGPAVTLPAIGPISLAGVKRADLESHMRTQLARYLRDPVIRAKTLIRVSIVGEVTRPGIYAVPTDLVLGDALMIAGGATTDAKFNEMRIERDRHVVVGPDKLQQALARGMTVDQLNLRAGDQIFVPRVVRSDPESKWRILGILVSIPVAIFTITRLSK